MSMPKFKRTAASLGTALSCVLMPVVLGCTGIMAGEPNGSTSGGTGNTPNPNGGNGAGGGSGGVGAGFSRPEVGVITIRRLNRNEYTNTLRALTGTKLDPGASFPPDNLTFGFDNIGEGNPVQPLHVEQFEKQADAILDELFALPATDPNRSKTLACDAATGGHACLVSTVLAFAERAYRRPVVEAEITPFVTIADSYTTSGGTAVDALKIALRAVLMSPNFLFRVELDASPTDKTVHRVSAYELASRLSYFFWSSMPDDALIASAKSGELMTDEGLSKQVTRLLSDEKAKNLIENFGGQWLTTRKVLGMKPDDVVYPKFDDALANAMATESSLFFAELVAKGSPITDLLAADFTYVDKSLAAFYGLPAPTVDGFQRVSLTGSPRVGFLTQGAFLTLTSNPTRTSPVKRGKWVLDQLLCAPPPQPPDGVDTDLPANGQSVRARLELHRAKEPCKTCHKLMDPIGLSFENFSGVGEFRTADEFGPIDATGTLETASGEVNFNGAGELVQLLTKDERLSRCLAQKVLTYAVGREFNNDDGNSIDKLLTSATGSGQGLRSVFGSVALSESFRSRRAVGE
jgi:hypothetical protein